MKEIRFKYKLKVNDLIVFNFTHLYSNVFFRIFLGINIIFLILFLFSIISGLKLSLSILSLPITFVLIFFVSQLYLIFSSIIGYSSNKISKEEKEILISQEYIKVLSKSTTLDCEWENLLKVIQTKTLLMFYISVNQAIIVPKRSLSVDQVKSINQIIKSKENVK